MAHWNSLTNDGASAALPIRVSGPQVALAENVEVLAKSRSDDFCTWERLGPDFGFELKAHGGRSDAFAFAFAFAPLDRATARPQLRRMPPTT
jgi:hypothetical protein